MEENAAKKEVAAYGQQQSQGISAGATDFQKFVVDRVVGVLRENNPDFGSNITGIMNNVEFADEIGGSRRLLQSERNVIMVVRVFFPEGTDAEGKTNSVRSSGIFDYDADDLGQYDVVGADGIQALLEEENGGNGGNGAESMHVGLLAVLGSALLAMMLL